MHSQPLTKYLRLFLSLAKFPFTTSETKPDHYRQELSVRIASGVAEQLET